MKINIMNCTREIIYSSKIQYILIKCENYAKKRAIDEARSKASFMHAHNSILTLASGMKQQNLNVD